MIRLKPEQYFPAVLILLMVGAAVVYAAQGDGRKALYWAAATVLNLSITF